MYSLNFYFLITAVLVCLFGRFLGKEITIKFNLVLLFLALGVNTLIFYEAVLGSVTEIKLFRWIIVGDMVVDFSFFYDFLSSSMLFLVTFISFFVHIYSYSYMDHDPSKIRFFCYLSFFTTFMSLLVVSDSLLQLFFAWEGVGISSYLLINFWYTRYEANRAAMKAVFVNRFGDFGLYTGVILFLVYFKTQSVSAINALSSEFTVSQVSFFGFNFNTLTFISFFIFLGVVGKSAQLGLHTWLPDAMEGPTPVSALLHAATMVTAGIYVFLRLSDFFQVSNIMLFIAFWGALTAFVASTIGAFQNDIKKIIAYSTCSQLGYMLAACGLYNFAGAYFHLFNHAFFKALLFLGAGSVIHAVGDEQDLRKYGSFLKFLPFTHICLLIASISLMGVPFFSGFYSKDIIINWAYCFENWTGRIVYFLLLGAAFFTVFYSLKVLYYTFYNRPRFSYISLRTIRESNLWIKLPMFVLSFFALASGYVFFDLFLGYGSLLIFDTRPDFNYYSLLEFLSQKRKFAPLFVVLLSSLYFIFVSKFYLAIFIRSLSSLLFSYCYNRLLTFFNKKWYFDYFYYFVVKVVVYTGYHVLFKNFDKGLLEKLFVKNIVWTVLSVGNRIKFMQVGNLTNYIMMLVTGIFVVLVFTFLLALDSYVLLFLFTFYICYLLCRK